MNIDKIINYHKSSNHTVWYDGAIVQTIEQYPLRVCMRTTVDHVLEKEDIDYSRFAVAQWVHGGLREKRHGTEDK
jgi:hypothetical protein